MSIRVWRGCHSLLRLSGLPPPTADLRNRLHLFGERRLLRFRLPVSAPYSGCHCPPSDLVLPRLCGAHRNDLARCRTLRPEMPALERVRCGRPTLLAPLHRVLPLEDHYVDEVARSAPSTLAGDGRSRNAHQGSSHNVGDTRVGNSQQSTVAYTTECLRAAAGAARGVLRVKLRGSATRRRSRTSSRLASDSRQVRVGGAASPRVAALP